MIDRKFLKDFNRDALAALQTVAKKHGVSVNQKGSRFTDNNAALKFEISVLKANGESQTKEALDFERLAGQFGLKPEDLGGTFLTGRAMYRITGLKARRPKYPICAERVSDGAIFKFPASRVVDVIPANSGRRAAIGAQKNREREAD